MCKTYLILWSNFDLSPDSKKVHRALVAAEEGSKILEGAFLSLSSLLHWFHSNIQFITSLQKVREFVQLNLSKIGQVKAGKKALELSLHY